MALIAQFHFNETSGLVATDTSGYGHDITFNNMSEHSGIVPAFTFSSGKFGNGITGSWYGNGPTANMANVNGDFNTSTLSLSFWIKNILNMPVNTGLYILLSSTVQIALDQVSKQIWFTTSTNGWAQLTPSITTNDWVHIALTFSGTQTKAYFNGILIYTNNIAHNIATVSTNPVIFNYGLNILTVDEYNIYNHVLSQAEVTTLYNQTNNANGLMFRYLFDDPDTTLRDSSGNVGFDTTYQGSWTIQNKYGKAGTSLAQNIKTVKVARRDSGGFVTVPFNPSGMGAFTVTFWFNACYDGQNASGIPILTAVSGANRFQCYWNTHSSGTPYFRGYITFNDVNKLVDLNDAFGIYVGGIGTIYSGTYLFGVLRYDGTTFTTSLYNEAGISLTGSVAATGVVSNCGNLIIGSSNTGYISPNWFNDLRVYNTKLSDSEVYDIFKLSGPKNSIPLNELNNTQINATWARSSTTITVTSNNHGRLKNDLIDVKTSSSVASVPIKSASVLNVIDANTFTIGGLPSGTTSGTITYDIGVTNLSGQSVLMHNLNSTTVAQPGIIDKSYLFDGVNDWINLAAQFANIQYFSSFTFSMWFKSTANNGGLFLISDGYSSSSFSGFAIIDLFNGKVKTQYRQQGTTSNIVTMVTDATYNNNAWHHVVYTRNNANHSLYVDNVLLKTGTNAGDSSAIVAAGLVVRLGFSSTYYNGYIDQFKTFDNALTAQDIQLLYEEGVGPLLCWNYRANYKGSNRLFSVNGGGNFPSELKVPSSVDTSTGMMYDEGQLIDSSKYNIIQ